MLQIRKEQQQQFRRIAAIRFEDAMVAHARNFAPTLYKVLGAEQMRKAVAAALVNARSYGFNFRGPLRLYVELVLLYGSGFDDDPQYPVLHSILQAPQDQMLRAEKIIEHINVFQEEIAGPDAQNVFRALQYLKQLARKPDRYEHADLDAQLLVDMSTAFSKKTAYVTEQNLRRLIAQGRADARRYGFEKARHQALLPILMFAFGHRCAEDPLYPWIGRTLIDEKIVDAQSRARRLERKATTWLDHVLDSQVVP